MPAFPKFAMLIAAMLAAAGASAHPHSRGWATRLEFRPNGRPPKRFLAPTLWLGHGVDSGGQAGGLPLHLGLEAD